MKSCFQTVLTDEWTVYRSLPWNEEAEFSDPMPLRCRNRKQLEYKVLLLLHPDERKQVMYNPRLYILLPQKWHEVHQTGKKMHPARP